MRQQGDPLADSVIDNLFSDNSIDSVNAPMRNLVQNEFPEPASLPPIVADYLKQADRPPLNPVSPKTPSPA